MSDGTRALGRASTRIVRRVRRWRRERAVARYEEGDVRLRHLTGHVSDDSIPVIMCLWNRPERIHDVLRVLSAQEDVPPVRLILWSNRAADRRHYVDAIRSAGVSGALASVEFVSSRVNVGGLARFIVVRLLRRAGHIGPVVTLDDDQEIAPAFLARLVGAYRPRSVHGVWAFRQGVSYWDRHAVEDGESADYIGTGGCIFDPSIVDDDGFFSELPDRYSFLEDQWMSWRAARAGWDLRKVDAPFEFVLAERNQYGGLLWLKDEFHAYLTSPDRR